MIKTAFRLIATQEAMDEETFEDELGVRVLWHKAFRTERQAIDRAARTIVRRSGMEETYILEMMGLYGAWEKITLPEIRFVTCHRIWRREYPFLHPSLRPRYYITQ